MARVTPRSRRVRRRSPPADTTSLLLNVSTVPLSERASEVLRSRPRVQKDLPARPVTAWPQKLTQEDCPHRLQTPAITPTRPRTTVRNSEPLPSVATCTLRPTRRRPPRLRRAHTILRRRDRLPRRTERRSRLYQSRATGHTLSLCSIQFSGQLSFRKRKTFSLPAPVCRGSSDHVLWPYKQSADLIL